MIPAWLLANPFPLLLGGVHKLWKLAGTVTSKINLQGWCGLALSAFLLIHFGGEARHWSKQSSRFEALYHSEQDGRAKDRAAYQAAQAAAQHKNDAQLATIAAQRHTIDEEVSHASDTNIQHLRDLSARGQLRPAIAEGRATQGGTSGTAPSAVSSSACIASDPAWLCLSPGDVLRAAESEERHDQLIDWVEAQASIDTSKEPNP